MDSPTNETSESSFQLCNLPYPLQCEIFSRITAQDAANVIEVFPDAQVIEDDLQMWRMRLWNFAKAVSVNMIEGVRSPSNLKSAVAIISDPLCLNAKTLYQAILPNCSVDTDPPSINLPNLLSKLELNKSSSMSFSSIFQDFYSSFLSIFGYNDNNAVPTLDPLSSQDIYCLFLVSEDRAVKDIMLSLIASESRFLCPVGLVKGKPGGMGRGVIVLYQPSFANTEGIVIHESHQFNVVPMRKVYPRLLQPTSGVEDKATFVDDVLEVVRSVNGFIISLDARCRCGDPDYKPTQDVTIVDGHKLEITALNILLSSIPSTRCPVVLIILAKGNRKTPESTPDTSSFKYHKPHLLQEIMADYHLPWGAFEVDVNNSSHLFGALNWLIRRKTVSQNGGFNHSMQ